MKIINSLYSFVKNNRTACTCLALFALLLLSVSCAPTDETRSSRIAKILFLPFDTEATSVLSLIFLILQGVAIYLSVFYARKAGWREKNIEASIYDKNHNEIGTYETGEVERWYVSEERAKESTLKVKFWASIARLALPRMVLVGYVASWIAKGNLNDLNFWTVTLFLIIAPTWIITSFFKTNAGADRTPISKICEFLYMVLLLVFVIVWMQ